MAAGFVVLLASADVSTPASGELSDPHAIYQRCIAMMNAERTPPFMIYTLHVDAHHLDVSRGYSSTGAPTTLMHFGTFRQQADYRVWYRASDQRSVMQDSTTHATIVAPPVPWALDLAAPPTGTASPSSETVSGNAAAIDQATRLLSQVKVDADSAYRMTLVGQEEYAGHRAYRVNFENISGDPNDHPLRTLVVDAVSFQPLEIVIDVAQSNMLYGGGLTLSANFSDVGGYWLSTDGAIVGNGHFTFISIHGTYSYSASNFSFPPQLPESMFAI